MKVRSHIEGQNKEELQYVLLHKSATDPALIPSAEGQFYYNTASESVKYRNSSDWVYLPYMMTPVTSNTLLLGDGVLLEPVFTEVDGFVKVGIDSVAYVQQYVYYKDLDPTMICTSITAPGLDSLIVTEKAVVDYVGSALATTIQDGMLDWATNKYQPYSTKKLSNPGYAYFFSDINTYPSYTNVLALDASLRVTNLVAMTSASQYSTISTTAIANRNGNYVTMLTYDSVGVQSRLYAYNISNSRLIPLRIGSKAVTGPEHGESIIIDDWNYLFDIDMTNVRFNKGTANKYLKLDANKYVTYVDAPAVSLTSDILEFSSTKYAPYTAKKGVNPGYAYFYTGVAMPSYTNGINLDGTLSVTQLIAGTTGVVAINGYSPDNTGAILGSGSGVGAVVQSNSSYALEAKITPTSTNTVVEVARIRRLSSNTAAAGIGGYQSFYIQNDSGSDVEAGRLAVKLTTVTAGAENSSIEWHVKSAGGMITAFSLVNTGKARLHTYGAGTHSGTATKSLAVDVSGNIIEIAVSTNYWNRVGTVLSPVTAGDAVSTSGYLTSSDGTGDVYTMVNNGTVVISRKASSPEIQMYRVGAGTNNGVQTNDTLSTLSTWGKTSAGTIVDGSKIEVKATENWSNTARGSLWRLSTMTNGTSAYRNRITIDGDGYTTFNEDGDPVNFRIEGDTDSNLFLVDGINDRVGIGTSGSVATKLHLRTSLTWGMEAFKVEQLDEDKAFIDYVGTSAANTTTNISTMLGTGAVVGPKTDAVEGKGWTWVGMVKIEVNGTEYWMPYYEVNGVA